MQIPSQRLSKVRYVRMAQCGRADGCGTSIMVLDHVYIPPPWQPGVVDMEAKHVALTERASSSSSSLVIRNAPDDTENDEQM